MAAMEEKMSFLQPATIADDNMEIASEIGPDDLDIDLEFAPEPHDEDDVLDDAKSDVGLDEDYDIQLLSSPVQLHDDLMVDEYNLLLPMKEGPEVVEESQIIDTSGAAVVTDAAINSLKTYELHAALPTDGNGFTELDWDQEPSHLDTAKFPGHNSEQGGTVGDNIDYQEKFKEVQESSASHSGSPWQEPGAVSEIPHGDQHSQHSELTPPSSTAPVVANGLNIGETDVAEVEAEDIDNVDFKQDEDLNLSVAATRRVIVFYRDMEYSLVPNSKDDNPDSYFLQDDTLTRAPLCDLLSAIREVIIEDLAPDEELSLAVNDFNIEITETSSSIFQVTLENIISLHTTLLRNDGVDALGPIYISLGCKPAFAKRLGTLSEGSAQGKGLSELVTWEETSESFDEEPSGHVEDSLAPPEDENSQFFLPDSVGSKNNEMLEALGSQVEGDEVHLDGDASQNKPQETAPEVGPNSYVRAENSQGGILIVPREDEGEDDLIDYEDDEDGQTQYIPASSHSLIDEARNSNGIHTALICNKPETCFCSVCNEALLAEYESINEELRRRSISRAAEDAEDGEANESADAVDQEAAVDFRADLVHSGTIGGLPEHSNEPSTDFGSKDENVYHEEHLDPEEYPEDVHELEVPENSDEWTLPGPRRPTHDEGVISEPAPLLDFPADHEGSIEQVDQTEDNQNIDLIDEEEIDFSIEPHEANGQRPHEGSSSVNEPELEDNAVDLDEIDYDEVNDALQSNEAEQALDQHDALIIDHDEIDYEDDDVPTATASLESNSTTSVMLNSNGVTGKRLRSADGDDAPYREGKDTKRVRS